MIQNFINNLKQIDKNFHLIYTYTINTAKNTILEDLLSMKPLLNTDEMIQHMKEKGIKFNIISENEAKKFLTESNYYMKLASYRTNYSKYGVDSKRNGQYINLEFAYLKELSTIDMYLRYIIMKMCLDIEHYLKVRLLHAIENNPAEDGYDIIRRFVSIESNSYILKKIRNHKSSEYCKNLIEKYYPYFPAWVFVELISFGDLTYLCDFYKHLYGEEILNNKFLNSVRDIRNAAAHSNCLINRLFDPLENGKQIDSDISNFVKSITDINSNTRGKNLNYRVVYDIITLLYVYDAVVTSKAARQHRYDELKDLFNNRIVYHRDYFKAHSKIVGVYNFVKKVVDNLTP